MLTASRLGDVLMVDIEHLHYGKLVYGEEGRVPSSEGYGVTRRSRGLDPSGDFAFRLPALLDVKRFDHDMIDPRANGRGIILVRMLPVEGGEPNRVVLVRARLRPEDGEGGHGRLHQQAAIWFVKWEDWRNYPAGILDAAAKLRADPDRVDDTKRFNVDPRQFPFVRWDGLRPREYSSGLKKMLDFLLPKSERFDDRCITFGEDDFPGEPEFLTTAGEALQNLPGSYPRWADISIAAGLRHKRGGLFIRYLPSHQGTSGPEIDEDSIRKRLERGDPKQLERFRGASGEVVKLQRVNAKPALPSVKEPAIGTRHAHSDYTTPFKNTLRRYRQQPEQTSALRLLYAAEDLARALWDDTTGQNPGQAASTTKLAIDEEDALQAIRAALKQSLANLRLGALFDLCDLFFWVRADQDYENVAHHLFETTLDRLATAQVLLPAEERHVHPSYLLKAQGLDAKTQPVLETSAILGRWFNAENGNGPVARREIPFEVLEALRQLGQRLPAAFNQDLDQDGLPPTGIHQKYVTTIDAVLSPTEYNPAWRKLLLSLPRLVDEICRTRSD
jgi:hypothetical protein